MDCLTYRRDKLASPFDARPALLEHARACPKCAAFCCEIEAFENGLQCCMEKVQVPDGLAEQIILKHRKPSWFNRGYLALAATVVVSAAALVAFNAAREEEDLPGAFIAHVIEEESFQPVPAADEPLKFVLAFAKFGGRVEGEIGEVLHVGECLVDGVLVSHTWVRTPYGNAALILMPVRSGDKQQAHTAQGYSSMVLPLGHGSLGIVTDSPVTTRAVEALVRSKVRWES